MMVYLLVLGLGGNVERLVLFAISANAFLPPSAELLRNIANSPARVCRSHFRSLVVTEQEKCRPKKYTLDKFVRKGEELMIVLQGTFGRIRVLLPLCCFAFAAVA